MSPLFVQLLTQNDGKALFIALQNTVPAAGEDARVLSNSYVHYLAQLGYVHSVAVFQHAIDFELEMAQQSHLAFRTNGFSARVLMDTLRLYGADYLKLISDPILDVVGRWSDADAKNHEVSRFRVEEADLQGRSMEVFISEARARLIAMAERLLASVYNTPVPDSIRLLLQEAQTRFAQKFPDATYHVTGSLLMLRLVIPHIAGLPGLAPETRRVLLRCLQFIQNIASGSKMKSDDDTFANDWIASKQAKFASFLADVSSTSLTAKQIGAALPPIELSPADKEGLPAYMAANPALVERSVGNVFAPM